MKVENTLMKPIPEFQELAMTLFAKEIVPTFLTSKFLKESQIIPKEWEFAQPPEIDAQTGYVKFTNDIFISARLGSATLSETLDGKNVQELKIPSLVRKWVQTLHKFDYQAIEIVPSSFFTFEKESAKSFHHYIPTALLTPGSWKEASLKPIRASLNLACTSEQGEFFIKIEDMLLREADNSLQPGAMFSGNFAYELSGNTSVEKLNHLYQLLENWQDDLENYRDIVNKIISEGNKK
jgi:hypothetical protein